MDNELEELIGLLNPVTTKKAKSELFINFGLIYTYLVSTYISWIIRIGKPVNFTQDGQNDKSVTARDQQQIEQNTFSKEVKDAPIQKIEKPIQLNSKIEKVQSVNTYGVKDLGLKINENVSISNKITN